MSLQTEQFVAVYLLGGPGSGKDAVLHNTVLNKRPIVEISLDKLHKAILEAKNVAEINEGATLVVNGNADDSEKVLITKKVLESVGYETLGVFVYTSDEVSRARNEQRMKVGSKTFSEEVRSKKYASSIKNLSLFQEAFSKLLIFNNSNNLMNEETQGWLIELNAELNGLLIKTEVDTAVEEFLEEDYNEYTAHQGLAQAARQKTAKRLSGNDYFSHNAMQNRPKTNKSGDKIPVPQKSSNVGPSHKFTEEKTTFKNFKSKKSSLPPPTATGHADGGNGMTQTEDKKQKPVKPPVVQGQIRPLTADGGASNPLAAEEKKPAKKSAKAPTVTTDARQGDDMAGVGTIGEGKDRVKKHLARKPVKTGQVADTNNQGQQQATTAIFSTEARSLSDIKSGMINRSPDEAFNEPEIYEDWGIEGEDVMFESRRVRTNKPFKRDKKYAVYVKDGADVKLMMFDRNKNSITLQENIKLTDVRFWETRQ